MMLFVFLFIFIHSLYYCYQKYERKKLDLFSYLILWYGIIYGLIPIFYFVDWEAYMSPSYWELIHNKTFFLESLIVLLGYMFLFFGKKTYTKKGVKIFSNLGNNYNSLFHFSIVLFIIG